MTRGASSPRPVTRGESTPTGFALLEQAHSASLIAVAFQECGSPAAYRFYDLSVQCLLAYEFEKLAGLTS